MRQMNINGCSVDSGTTTDRFNSVDLTAIIPSTYDELRCLASSYLRRERPDHTLQRTALVHEAYLRLLNEKGVAWESRPHFLRIVSRLMRQILINHALAKKRLKRGGPDPAPMMLEYYERKRIDVSAIDDALRELESIDPRQGQIVELRFFAGLTVEEIAETLGVSISTVNREWTLAKVWLKRHLSDRAD